MLLLQRNNATTINGFEWTLYSHKVGDHCLLHDERLFCRDQDSLPSNVLSCTKGIIWNFSTLKDNSINTDDLMRWRTPFEIVEDYASYLDTNSKDGFICNCTRDRIGSACQYMLFSDQPTIAEVLKKQLRNPHLRDTALFTCLVDSVECNAGLLCLEWRQVCDGIVNCDNGADEAGCDVLEFQKCASDEFQCRNSMCIPTEFLFDGAIDCMDSSDEQELTKIRESFSTCSVKPTMDCDERLCRKDQFSCGDGQCIHWSNVIHHQKSCANARDSAYHCEAAGLITMSSGVCSQKKSGE